MNKNVSQGDVDALVEVMKANIKRFNVCWKEESWLQRAIGKIISPINQGYMTSYATTMFGKIWLPSNARYWSADTKYKLYRHEFIHLLDAKKFWLFFSLSYLFLLPAVLTMRAFWELRGYTQSLISFYEIDGDISDDDIDWITSQFTSGLYLWMWPFRSSIRNKLWAIKVSIKANRIGGMYPYDEIALPRLEE